MKILITWFPLMDPGGITNNIEQLGQGLMELGHKVDFYSLEWKERIGAVRTDIIRDEKGIFGYQFNQGQGWHFPFSARIPYKGADNLRKWKTLASQYDVILWEIPVPPANSGNRGNLDWIKLYDLPPKVKQIVVTHDGNIMANAHILKVAKKLHAVATTHPCSQAQARFLPLRRFMIGSPHDSRSMPEFKAGYWGKRPRAWLSVQTFKRWKRVDDLVRAVPHMPMNMGKVLAGKGIEYHYMTSKEKVKDAYLDDKGRPIWGTAVKAGMRYLGWISNAERDKVLRSSRLLIDASYSRKYSEHGDHFNRVAFEALAQGAIPVLRTRGSIANEDGSGEFFSNGVNCMTVPWDCSSKAFAELITTYADLPAKEAEKLVARGRDLMGMFDRRNAAMAVINSVKGVRVVGISGDKRTADNKPGVPTRAMKEECARLVCGHFGGADGNHQIVSEDA